MPDDNTDAANPWLAGSRPRGTDYDAPYRARERAGENVHGEADFVQALGPRSVLDAGCGTGRVGAELARRGIAVIGVDLDPGMLAAARAKAPDVDWRLGDLATADLGRSFDVIVMAGNVMIFLTPGSEGAVVRNMARHLAPGGALVAGFQLSVGYLQLPVYDRLAKDAGLGLAARYATWDGAPWSERDNYAVSVHRHRSTLRAARGG
jgi:SAM-dependent methyltransferase